MLDGMNLDPEILSEISLSVIAQDAVRAVQFEAAVQQLAREKQALTARIEALEAELGAQAEDE